MRKFNTYSKNRLIGWTNLPNVDVGMGISDGKFIPTGDYESVRAEIVATFGRKDQGFLKLSLKTEQGEPLVVHQIYLMDQSHIYGEDCGYEIVVGGFTNLPLSTLFKDECEKHYQINQDNDSKGSILIVNLDRRDE